jgi:hypothetical protein
MDIQTKQEERSLNIIAVGMPIMLVIGTFFFGAHVWWAKNLSNPVVRLLETGVAKATICGISIQEPERLITSFEEIITNKNSGSLPLSLEVFVVKTKDDTYILQLGNDSRNKNLFWIYPESGQLNNIVGGDTA